MDKLSLLVQFILKPWLRCASPPASLLFSKTSGSADTEPTLSCLYFFAFHPILPHFPHRVYNSSVVSFAYLPLLRPSRSHLRSRPVPIVATALVSVLAPVPAHVPVPILCSSTGLHPRPRSRPRSHLASLRSPLTPFLFPLRLRHRPRHRPRHRSRPRPRLLSRPRLRSRPDPVYARSRSSDTLIPSVRYAFTGSGHCETICRVPASATPCFLAILYTIWVGSP